MHIAGDLFLITGMQMPDIKEHFLLNSQDNEISPESVLTFLSI